jgi:hypothetical protein
VLAPEQLLDGLEPVREPGVGWAALRDIDFIGEMAMVLGLAITLAAVIAYHPTLRRKASTLAEIEQPKTFILYSMIGALIAIVVKVQPSMALVVFGIGGLMRFRTDVGQAKDTGRVILVTVVGLSCGLELYVVALLTTVLAWVLILVLESRSVECLIVQGLEKEAMDRASEAYLAALRELGCTIVGEDKRVKKGSVGSVAILYRTPRGLARARLERRLAEIPDAQRGTISWESV